VSWGIGMGRPGWKEQAKNETMKKITSYIGGKWVEGEKVHETINPATGEKVTAAGLVPRSGVAAALEAAHGALAGWRGMSGKQRGEFLRVVAEGLLGRKEDVAELITLENGKPLAQARGEVDMAADHLVWFAEEARRGYGRVIPWQVGGKRHVTVKTPVGVVGAVSPWNFPLVLAVRKVAPALAAGCPVVLKPASQTPGCAHQFTECVEAAGVAPGVFNLVLAKAGDVGAEFLENPLCRKITFTGSTPVGQMLIRGAAGQVKPLSLELGGHAPVLVFEDADVDVAVEGVMVAKFRNIGQSCIAANRIFVQAGIYDEFLGKFIERVKALKVGNGMEAGVDIGPLVDAAAVDNAVAHVEDAVRAGAVLHCGGTRIENGKGSFFAPAVLSGVSAGALCMREETFAPVAPVCRFATEEEGVAAANDSVYGLAAYAFTRDMARGFRLMEALEAGTIGINDGAPSTSQCPFGGLKQSGWGRELGVEGMDAFLETKHVSVGGVQ
jgi:succinate-semialdehyde dehydrogenase / glutarate-semialdehyde dehydrogenase